MKLTQIMDIYTEGIGRVIASGYAMKQFIPFLATARTPQMLWIKKNGIQLDNLIEEGKKVVHNENRCEPNCSFCESVKAHYADMKDFFDSQLSNLQIQAHMPFCSRCGNNVPAYIGFIQGTITLTSFSFCVDCRDELTFKKNAVIAAQERIGA